MSRIEIKVEGSKIKVNAPYDKKFIDKAHGLNGKWAKPNWVFSIEDESEVRKACFEIFGDDGRPQETVTLSVDLEQFIGSRHHYSKELRLGGRLLVSRPSRDSKVRLSDGIILQQGNFSESGGSAKNPSIDNISGVILKVKGFPKVTYDALENKNGITIINDTVNIRAELEAEKAKLLVRLAEIEAKLSTLTEM